MPPWLREFRERASRRRGNEPLLVTLATCESTGSPRARTVVIRRLTETGSLWITSDARSRKNAQLDIHPEAEAVCWLAEEREQWRLLGVVNRLTAAHRGPERQQVWRQLSDATRATFSWPPPGEVRAQDAAAFPRSVTAEAFPPMSFELLVLEPNRVECLQTQVHPHRRREWNGHSDWQVLELNP